MRLVLLIPTAIWFYFYSILTMDSGKKEIDFNTIKKEIEWFIDNVKVDSYKQGLHNVYALRFTDGFNEGNYCFTIGYVENGSNYNYLKQFRNYFHLKDELILIDYSDNFNEKFLLKNADSIKLLINKQIVTNRLDMEIEAIGTWPGYVCCYESGKINKVFYENSDEIPSIMSIFNFPPSLGTVLEIDSASFKKMLKEKQKLPMK